MSEAVVDMSETVEQGAVPADSASNVQATQEDEFWTRVKSDPEYAVEQIKKRDGKTTELSNRLKSMENVEKMVEIAGSSDALLGYAQRGARIDQIPGLAEVVNQAFQSGRVELPTQATPNGQDEDDQWMIDPDVKAATDPLKAKIAALEARLGELGGVLNAANVRSMQSRIEENVEGALSMFAANEEAMAEARQVLESEIKAAMSAAERGDEQQTKLIESLSTPAGRRTLETALFDTYRKHAAKLVAGTSHTQASGETAVLGRQTDERSTSVARPDASGLPPRPKGRVGGDYALEVLRAAGRQRGIDTRQL